MDEHPFRVDPSGVSASFRLSPLDNCTPPWYTDPMNAKEVGRLVKERRIEMGLSKARLAELLNCSEDAVRTWEKGTRTPGLTHVAKLVEVLGDKWWSRVLDLRREA